MEIIEKTLRHFKTLKKTSVLILLGFGFPFYWGFGAGGISITEIMYHPLDVEGIDDRDLEFIEIKNITEAPVDLSVASFTDGVEFTFGPSNILGAGEYWVFVSDFEAFSTRYPGVTVKGEYSGQLNNSGENLELSDRNGVLFEAVNYEDMSPWPPEADGGGKSMVKRIATAIPSSPNDATAWRASFNTHGSPGQEDPAPLPGDILVNEVLPHTDLPQVDSIELYNPTQSTVDISGWYISDELVEPKKYRIPDTTLIQGGGYLLFSETEFAAETQGDASFRFNSHGDSAWLISADGDDNLSGYTHGFTFGASANGLSFSRYLDSEGTELFAASETLTLGSENSPPLIGPLVISEILYKQGAGGTEFIELINVSDEPVPLFDPENPENVWSINGLGFEFPAGVSVQPKQVVIVANVDPSVFQAEYGVFNGVQVFGPFPGSLDNAGERITIERPDSPDDLGGGEIFVPYIDVDSVPYKVDQPWPVPDQGSSIEKVGRTHFGQDPGNWEVSLLQAGSPGMVQDLDFSTWLRIHFNDSEITSNLVGLEDDFDGDGVLNLWEYAFGLNPHMSQSIISTRSLIVPDSGNQYPAINFRQLIHTEDLIYQVEESTDLHSWNEATNYFQSSSTNNGDGTLSIVLRAPDPLISPGAWFHRLKILLSETD